MGRKKTTDGLESNKARLREGRDFYRVGVPRVKRAPSTEIGLESGLENLVAKAVVDTAFRVHTALRPGMLESVYEVVLAHELREQGFEVERQVPLPIIYKGLTFQEGFRADLIVDKAVIVELKSVDCLLPVHAKQLLTQLRLTKKRLGLLINFGAMHLKDNIRRLSNGMNGPVPEQ